jgi:hypothetical protein
MSCAGCKKKATGEGCEAHKAPQRVALDDAIARLYPAVAGGPGAASAASPVWGQLDAEAAFGAGIRPAEVRRLAQALSVAARAPTFVRPGGDDDLCAFVYVLCVGRAPGLLDVRDERAPVDLGIGEERVRERWLRVALSSVARMATVQEVAFELDRLDASTVEIRELGRPGVYDPVLLKRMRAVVDLLAASDILHLDFGLVDRPIEGADESAYTDRYGTRPHLVNYLFYAAPVATSSVTIL